VRLLWGLLFFLLISGCAGRGFQIKEATPEIRTEISRLSRGEVPEEPGGWTSFQGGPLNNGISGVEIGGTSLEVLWEFSPGKHVWEYGQEMAAWSPCPVFGDIQGRTLLFTGCHDRNIYCLEAATGKMLWQRATGGLALSSPLLIQGKEGGMAVLVVVSSDRSIHGIDPSTGTIQWTRELYPWTNTVTPSLTSSPALWVRPGAEDLVVATIFNTDMKWFRPVREGLLLLATSAGEIVLRKSISSTPVSSPAVISLGKDRAVALVAERKGRLMAFSLPEGDLLWHRIFSGNLYATPSVIRMKDGRFMVVVGDFYGRVETLDAITGETLWEGAKLGYFINATPALMRDDVGNGGIRFFVGSFDRMVHGFDADAGKRYFSLMTGKYVASCCTTARMNGRNAVLVQSLDRNLYAIDAADGSVMVKMRAGDMIWPYERPGRTLWSSPVPVMVKGRGAMVVVPFHDGRIRAFMASDASVMEE
jgi:outer membrane protein assembly factor BamB